MSDIINNYLKNCMTFPHNEDTKSIDKEINRLIKLEKHKTKRDEADSVKRQIEFMIKNLIK